MFRAFYALLFIWTLAAQAEIAGKTLLSTADELLIRESTVRITMHRQNGKFARFCSGVLTGPNEVMSAQHCVQGFTKEIADRQVFVEIPDPKAPGGMQRIVVTDAKFDISGDPDISLLTLKEKVNRSRSLPMAYDGCDADLDLWSAGYGMSKPNGKNDILGISIYNRIEQLDKSYAATPGILLLKNRVGHECGGDSGGPIFCKSKGLLAIAGVNSKIGHFEQYQYQTHPTTNEDWLRLCLANNMLVGPSVFGNMELINRWRDAKDAPMPQPAPTGN